MRKARNIAKPYVFPMICRFGGSKNRLAKAAGAEPAGGMRNEFAYRCGVTRISKSKRASHFSTGSLFEIEMSKKHTPL